MVTYIPQKISNTGFLIYAISIVLVSLAFINFAIDWRWMLLGFVEVGTFFLLSNRMSRQWQRSLPKNFALNLFTISFLLRLAWVVFSYFFYINLTGQPFEFDAADSLAYHEDPAWLASEPWETTWNYLFRDRAGYSDSGYVLYMTVVYKIFGPSIFFARVLKCVISSITVVLLYRLATRTAGEEVGRMTGVFAMLMPNLIIYCGLHLKETEMVFLLVAFLERADHALRAPKIRFWDVAIPLLLGISLFTFRTVLGAVALFAFIAGVLFNSASKTKWGRRIRVAAWILLALGVMAGGAIVSEVEQYWNDRGSNQALKREQQTFRGNQWARYATAPVMAPMMFVIPLSTMVDTGQENQMVMHGGNFVRNFMGAFVILTLVSVFFEKKNWRDFSLLGSFVIGYLMVIAMSGFANSERFVLPALPVLIIMWAYGISELNMKKFRFVRIWYIIVPVMEFAWAYFKIGSRGLL